MEKLQILKNVLVRTRADKIITTYLLFVLLSAIVIRVIEPGISNLPKALWYCYSVISTAGFGDVVVTTFIGKLISVLLTVYSLLVIALVTGVIVNYYNQLIQIRQKETLAAFTDKLQRLPELSEDELKEISQNVRQYLGNREQR